MNKIKILKQIYNLQGEDVEWVVVEEKTKEETTYKLGLSVIGTRLYVDIVARRFFTTVDWPEISRQVYPAKEIPSRGVIIFEAKDDSEKNVIMPKSFLSDIYANAWYNKSLEGHLLL